jgi:hypothetical protein
MSEPQQHFGTGRKGDFGVGRSSGQKLEAEDRQPEFGVGNKNCEESGHAGRKAGARVDANNYSGAAYDFSCLFDGGYSRLDGNDGFVG